MDTTMAAIVYEPRAGENVADACAKLADLANSHQVTAMMTFNGTVLLARPGSEPDDIAEEYQNESRRIASIARDERRGRTLAAAHKVIVNALHATGHTSHEALAYTILARLAANDPPIVLAFASEIR